MIQAVPLSQKWFLHEGTRMANTKKLPTLVSRQHSFRASLISFRALQQTKATSNSLESEMTRRQFLLFDPVLRPFLSFYDTHN